MTWSLLSDWQTKYHMIFNIWLTDRIWHDLYYLTDTKYDMIFNIWLADKIWHDLYYLSGRQNITWSLLSDWQTKYDMIFNIWLTQNMTWSLLSDWQTTHFFSYIMARRCHIFWLLIKSTAYCIQGTQSKCYFLYNLYME